LEQMTNILKDDVCLCWCFHWKVTTHVCREKSAEIWVLCSTMFDYSTSLIP
jgi:hypothetical protein